MDPMETTSTSHGRRSRPPSPPSSSSRLKLTDSSSLVEVEEEASTMYMFVSHPTGPISYSVFALDVLDKRASSWLQPCNTGVGGDTRKCIYPNLEFLARDFPFDMCCVKLGSKLYLFGGCCQMGMEYYDFEFYTDLYIIDTSSLSPNPSSTIVCDKTSLPPFIVKGPSMKTGKPYGQAFTVAGKIYVILTSFLWNDMVEFEMFDPDTNEWSTLPDSPIEEMSAHVVVLKNKVIVGTEEREFFCYDVNSCKWDDIGELMPKYPENELKGNPAACGDFVYALHGGLIAQFGPTTEHDIETKVDGLFQWTSYISSPVASAVSDAGRLVEASACLVHLGNKLFCCAISGGYVKPGADIDRTRADESVINIVIFRVPDETSYEPADKEHIGVVFGAELVRAAQLFLRSHNGAKLPDSGLMACLS